MIQQFYFYYALEGNLITQKDISHPHVHWSIMYNSQDMKTI